MNEQLDQLIKLQTLDTRLLADKSELAEIPERLRRTEKVLDGARTSEGEFRQRLDAAQKEKKKRDSDLEDCNQRIKTLKSRMSEVKTNVEYQARLKEIAAAEETARKIEDGILDAMEQIETIEREKPGVEQILREANREWEATKKKVEESGKTLEAEVARLLAERNALVPQLPKDTYEQYRILMQEKQGLAVARIEKGICRGCQMNIPPQFFNEVRASDKIHTCPTCSRILYYQIDLAIGESV